ncbi:hypothetical protein K0M31_006779 [Melipona bicolor]|uniref:RNase H type-1 domain-containing protein n=1 Tax=Melipona bicolor TaxID=60889 RepID=A0AA40FSE0_9HYME|nr:hypothetical protein K0M31_006779 [Melipona bicolor]
MQNLVTNPKNGIGTVKDLESYYDIVLQIHHKIFMEGKEIKLWIPSHTGICGNEKADQTARETANLETTTDNNGRFD